MTEIHGTLKRSEFLPVANIKNATILPERVIKHKPLLPEDNFNDLFPYSEDSIVFNLGHSTGLYKYGSPVIVNNVWALRLEDEELRFIKLPIADVIADPDFRKDIRYQYEVLNKIRQEIFQYPFNYIAQYKEDLSRPDEFPKRRREQLVQLTRDALVYAESTVKSYHEIQFRAIQKFLDECEKAGIDLKNLPDYAEVSKTVTDDLKLISEMEKKKRSDNQQ